MNIFSFTRYQDDITIGVEAPQYWWDDFIQCTEIVPKLYPLLLNLNMPTMFSEFEDTGLITMLKDAILQAYTEYQINPSPKTTKMLCEILPMCIQRRGYIHAKVGQVVGWVDSEKVMVKTGTTSDEWDVFLTEIKRQLGR